MPSCMREKPGPLVAVMHSLPAPAAPNIMLTLAVSHSACTNVRPSIGNHFAAPCAISLAGVIG